MLNVAMLNGVTMNVVNEYYKKRVLVQNKSSLLLKIISYNTLTLQLFTIKTKLC
jgi:hypothetical protein